MNKRYLKTGIALISYTAALVLIVVYIKEIFGGINTVLNFAAAFFVGILIALFLNPPYRVLMKLFDKIYLPKALARFISTIFVFALAAGIITGIVMVVIPEVMENSEIFFSNFNNYVNSLQKTIDFLIEKFNLESFDITPLRKVIENIGYKFQDFAISLGPKAVTYSKKIISSIANLLIGIVFSIYMLNVKDNILKQINRLAKAIFGDKVYRVVSHIGRVSIRTFDSYIVGQTIEAIILGILFFLGMKAFGFAYAELISVIVAVTALLPMIGAYIGGFFGVFIYLLVDPVKALFFLLYFIILQQIENNLIYPKVVGKKVGLPGIWIILAVLLGSNLGGLIGALCAVPVFTIFYTLLRDLTIYKENQKKLKKITEKEENLKQTQKESRQFELNDEEYQKVSNEPVKNIKTESKNTITDNKNDKNTSYIDDISSYIDKEEIEKVKQESYREMELEDSEIVAMYIPNSEDAALSEKLDNMTSDKTHKISSDSHSKPEDDKNAKTDQNRAKNLGFFSDKLKNSLKK